MELRKEKCCGCIIIENNKVLLVYEKNRNFWGFPKGHMEKGENEIETALREVKEEVGLDVEIIDKERRYILKLQRRLVIILRVFLVEKIRLIIYLMLLRNF